MNIPKENIPKTAVLLFAQSEKVESALKPIAYSAKQNLLLWKKMNNRVLKTIQKTELPYFISNETNQVGTSFGDKMTHAMQTLFEKGYEKVIVVGNDCIALKTTQVIQAMQKLQTNCLVLGADNAGGTYLIGATKKNFDANAFKKIAWQTNHVFVGLQHLYQNLPIAYIATLNDFNTKSDFKKALDALSFSESIRNVLHSFLITCKNTSEVQAHFASNTTSSSYFNKGSPVQ